MRLPRGRSRRRWLVVALALDLVVLGAGALLGALVARLDHVTFDPPRELRGDTWVIVGSDSRDSVRDEDRPRFGTPASVPGARADVVLVLQRIGGRTALLSIPRDLLVTDRVGTGRLALTLRTGPQRVVDALCSTLGLAADHLVIVEFEGFRRVVDAVGGIEIEIRRPLRDTGSGLELRATGRQRIDGATALALVRSRRPEELIEGSWVPSSDGPAQRSAWTAVAFAELAERLGDAGRRPLTLWRAAWALSPAVAVDRGTALVDLIDLLGRVGRPEVLATRPLDGVSALRPGEGAPEQLRALGAAPDCEPAA